MEIQSTGAASVPITNNQATPESHPRHRVWLVNFEEAMRYRKSRKHRKARQKLKFALREAAHFPEYDERLATTLLNLIQVHVELNDAVLSADEALALAQHCARVHKICYEQNGEKAAIGLIAASSLLHDYGWFPDAEELLDDAIKRLRSHKPRTPGSYESLFNALYKRITLLWSHPEFEFPHTEFLELITEAFAIKTYFEADVSSESQALSKLYRNLCDEVNAKDAAEPWSTSNPEMRALVELLGKDPYELPDSVQAAILQKGKQIVPVLLAIIADDVLYRSNAPGEGFVPMHAIDLLAELQATEAIEPMLQVLGRCDVYGDLPDSLIRALCSFGEKSLEPMLAAYQAATSDGARDALAAALAQIAVKDARILPILLDLLARNVGLGAVMLGAYGDDAALPFLSDALDASFIFPDRPGLAYGEKSDLVSTIEYLGGSLTEEQARKWETSQRRVKEQTDSR